MALGQELVCIFVCILRFHDLKSMNAQIWQVLVIRCRAIAEISSCVHLVQRFLGNAETMQNVQAIDDI